jgi:hypothetical protein
MRVGTSFFSSFKRRRLGNWVSSRSSAGGIVPAALGKPPIPFVEGRTAAGRCKTGLQSLPPAAYSESRPIFVIFSVGNILILPFKYLLSDPHP